MDITQHRITGEELEQEILAWIDHTAQLGTVERPYVWPGSWPDNDLRDMGRSLPGWQFDSAWIYYEHWDPEIPAAVERFNRDQDQYRAQVIHREGVYHPPRDIIAVLDRGDAQQIILAMWLKLGERS